MNKDELEQMLLRYLDKLRTDTLSVEESVNLVDFFVNDVNTLAEHKDKEVSVSDLFKYMSVGWYLLHKHSE